MFEYFFDDDSFDFADISTAPAEGQIIDVPAGSDTSVTTGLDAGSVPTDPVDPGTLPGLIPTDPTASTGVEQGSNPDVSGSGTDGDAAITLDDFSLFSIDVFA